MPVDEALLSFAGVRFLGVAERTFSEAPTGEWNVEDFIGMGLHFLGCNVPFPPSQS